MTADEYLQKILGREAVDTSATSPVRGVQAILQPALNEWAGDQLRAVSPSGSFAKGTANHSGTDIDLFISLKSDTTNALKEIYTKLFNKMKEKGYNPKSRGAPGQESDFRNRFCADEAVCCDTCRRHGVDPADIKICQQSE
jgi:tRNA nucleotidyltransferase (CCA-adding enzyme)